MFPGWIKQKPLFGDKNNIGTVKYSNILRVLLVFAQRFIPFIFIDFISETLKIGLAKFAFVLKSARKQ